MFKKRASGVSQPGGGQQKRRTGGPGCVPQLHQSSRKRNSTSASTERMKGSVTKKKKKKKKTASSDLTKSMPKIPRTPLGQDAQLQSQPQLQPPPQQQPQKQQSQDQGGQPPLMDQYWMSFYSIWSLTTWKTNPKWWASREHLIRDKKRRRHQKSRTQMIMSHRTLQPTASLQHWDMVYRIVSSLASPHSERLEETEGLSYWDLKGT